MISETQFIGLFLHHEAELRAFAMSLLPQRADAEEVLQEACVAMWKRIGDLRDEEAFRAWAYTFVRFTALNKVRRQQRRGWVFSEELTELLAEEGEAEAARARAELDALTHCLETLPSKQRDIVKRYYASSRVRMADLARKLERNVAGLYKAMERTRDALRVCIEQRLKKEGFEIKENSQ
ncbi:MAG TPA: sigma-70 family RNA polymerase sigma factor [Opitutales bacterium]|nr:sigma-70 family RNA polymerase sigma factor [Opitutales bacterium]